MRKLLLTLAIYSLVLFAFPFTTEAAQLKQTSGGNNVLFIPAVRNERAVIYIHNNGNTQESVTVFLHIMDSIWSTGSHPTLGPKETIEIHTTSCDDGCSAEIIPDQTSANISAVVHNYYYGGDDNDLFERSCNAASPAVKKSDAAYTVYLPEVVAPNSQVYVQNAGNNNAIPVMTLYNNSSCTQGCKITGSQTDAGKSYLFNMAEYTNDGTYSAIITSSNTSGNTTWAVDVHYIDYPRHGSYLGSTTKVATQLFLPVLFIRGFEESDWSSYFTIQQASNTGTFNPSIKLRPEGSTSPECNLQFTPPSYPLSKFINFPSEGEPIPGACPQLNAFGRWHGSGRVVSSGLKYVHGFITEFPDGDYSYRLGYRSLSGISYGAATNEVVLPYMPVNSGLTNPESILFGASFTVQNLESSSKTITLHFYNSNGGNEISNVTSNHSSCNWIENSPITLNAYEVKRCYLPKTSLPDGLYSMHIQSNGKVGAIGHVVGDATDDDDGDGDSYRVSDWETAYTGMSN